MSNLDNIKALIATGHKDAAIKLLASLLMKNKDEVEAWLLLGELIDDPARKRDCYNQVLRLSPLGSHALARLKELEEPPTSDLQMTSAGDTPPANQGLATKFGRRSNYSPHKSLPLPNDNSEDDKEIIGYVIGGIAAFLVILYVSISPGTSSNDSNTLYVGLILLGLIAVIIIFFVSSKNQI